jgi:tetratricopeptide (TPR) repeat protein
VQLYFNQKQYSQAISEGNDLLNEDISADYKAEVHKIIGESYFMQKQYSEAYPHLKEYLQTQQNPSESDLYEMGFVAANLQKFDEAISYYNQLLNSKSALAQNAYYQLGNAYLEVGKKQEALAAFRSAKEMTYDKNVSKLAHEQYAKLSYDIGNPFESPQIAIKSYLEKYGYSKELEQLLVKSYLYSGDYKGTIKAIEELTGVDAQTEKIYQEVLFLYGTELFNKGELDAAEQNFKKSLKYNLNKTFNLRAQYWLAQTYYQKGDYATAIYGFEKLDRNAEEFPEKQQLSYDLGYAYFKSKILKKLKNISKNILKIRNQSLNLMQNCV